MAHSNISPACKNITLMVISVAIACIASCSGDTGNNNNSSPTQTTTGPQSTTNTLAQSADSWKATLAADPSDPQANFRLGLILAITSPEESGQYFESAQAGEPALGEKIDRITGALRLGDLSDNPAYRLTLLGQAFGAIEDWDMAEQALLLAAEIDPTYAEAWAYLGEAQQQNGQDGYEALSTALLIDEDSYAANLFMALYWRRNDQPMEALPHLLAAGRQDPNNLLLKQDIAHTYAETGEVEIGLDLLDEAVEMFPDQPQAWQILARFCLDYDIKLEEVGLPAARQAVILDDSDPDGLLLLGRSYFQTGNMAMAERFFIEASDNAPDLPEPHYYLGLLYLNQGERQTAKTHLETCSQLAPNSSVGKQALSILEEYFSDSP